MSPSTAFRAKSSTTERRAPRGQSFIEAMVAITIIITAISSSLALIQSSITASRIGGLQVVAANLAREGIEVIRAMRDTNWLQGRSFQVGLVDAGGEKVTRPFLDQEDGESTLAFGGTTISDDSSRVYVMPDGLFRQADSQPSGSTVSPYNRIAVLDHICRMDATGAERIVDGTATCTAGTETLVGLAVTVTVRWMGVGGRYQTLVASEHLYDWR